MTGDEAADVLTKCHDGMVKIIEEAIADAFKLIDSNLAEQGYAAGHEEYPKLMTTALGGVLLAATVSIVSNSRIRPDMVESIFTKAFAVGFHNGSNEWIGNDPEYTQGGRA